MNDGASRDQRSRPPVDATLDRALKFPSLLHSEELDAWQIEAVKAILFKK